MLKKLGLFGTMLFCIVEKYFVDKKCVIRKIALDNFSFNTFYAENFAE